MRYIRMFDDSMSPDIKKGDILHVVKENIKSGQICVIRSKDGYLVRQLILQGETFLLLPVNCEYDATIAANSQAKIEGRVCGITRLFC